MTVDLDATQITVYGRRKEGAARCRTGEMSYAPHIAFWAQRGRALMRGAGRRQPGAADAARSARRSPRARFGLLPDGHGPVTMRIDSAYYAIELLERLRREKTRFTVSVPRNQAMWKALARIPDSAWLDALDMPGAQVAEITYRPGAWKHEPLRLIVRRVPFTAEQIARLKGSRRLQTIHPEQLQMALDGQLESVYGYSFILTDIYHQPHRLGRALPPPPRADRRAHQGHQDGPGAAPPPLRRHQRQPRLAHRRDARRQPHRILLRPLSRRRRLRPSAREHAAAPPRPCADPVPRAWTRHITLATVIAAARASMLQQREHRRVLSRLQAGTCKEHLALPP